MWLQALLYLVPLLLAFLLLLFLVPIFLLMFPQVRGDRNPFATDTRRPPAPLVTDKAVRRTVVKTVFSPEKVPPQLDAIVVGSGVGGLAVAALLAKAGRRVLVLEQHGKLGGCCHTFTEKGFEFDTGIHYVGEMRESSLQRFVVDQLTDGQLEWAQLPSIYDAVILGDPQGDGKTYQLHAGRREYFQKLKEQFPGEAAAIDEFRRLVKSTGRGVILLGTLKMLPRYLVGFLCRSRLLHFFFSFCRLSSCSVKEVVESLTPNPELRAVFSYLFPTYGVIPSRASFSVHSILVNHFLHGAWYPKGGSGEIPFHLISVIRKTGGNVFGRAPVERILLDPQGRACGVSVRKGEGLVNVFAPMVISDAGIFNTYEKLLPPEAQALPEIQSQLRLVSPGEGCFTVFVGLSGSREELGVQPTNYFLYLGNDLDGIMKRYLESSREEAAKNMPFLFVTSPSSKDPTWEMRHPGKSTLAIVTLARYEWFEEWKDKQVHKRGDDYEDLKKTFVDAIMETVTKLYPRIEGRIEYLSSGTPLTNQHYIASPHGELYGADHGIPRLEAEVVAALRAKTAVPNLYLTGQDLCLGGFMGALQGAIICASTILKRNLYVDALRLKKHLEATNAKKGD